MNLKDELKIPFYKMQGSGNDFIFLIRSEVQVSEEKMPIWAKRICPRSFGVGGDGLIFLETDQKSPQVDYQWHFFNADGSRAEMCGNGSRCAARLAYELGWVPSRHVLGTDAGPVKAEVFPDSNQVKVELTKPFDLKTNLDLDLQDGRKVRVHFVNTGVPHVVYLTEKADELPILEIGPKIRYHQTLSPAGANVNLVQILEPDSIYVRTYERGVESETYACGTGATASAYITKILGLSGDHVFVKTSGGEKLEVVIEDGQVFLQGKAELIYKGYLNLKAVGLDDQSIL